MLLVLLWPPAARAAEREVAFHENFYDVAVHGSRCWIVGYYGTILHSRDRGLSWSVQESNTREALFRVVFLDADTGWISGSYGTLLRTRDGGRSWQRLDGRTQEHLLALHFLDPRLGWAAGSRGVVLRTADGGDSWEPVSLGDDVIINDVRFRDPREGWLVGEFGRIYRTTDGGRSWTKQKSPIEVTFASGESRNLFRLLLDSSAGTAFGLDGTILETRSTRWEIEGSKRPRRHLFAAASSPAGHWAVGERGTVLVRPRAGSGWRPAPVKAPPVSLNGIAFGTGGLGLIVGNRGTLLRTEDGGRSWKPVALAAPGRRASR